MSMHYQQKLIEQQIKKNGKIITKKGNDMKKIRRKSSTHHRFWKRNWKRASFNVSKRWCSYSCK